MKKIKNIISIGLIILLTFINWSYADKEGLKNEDLFIKAFEETGADFFQLNLNFSGTMFEDYKDREELSLIMDYIIKELDLIGLEEKEEAEYEDINTEAFSSCQIVTYGKDKDQGLFTIILYSYLDKEANTGETSIVIDITQEKDYNKLGETTRKIENLYKTYNIKSENTYCIIGTFEAELDMRNVLKKITKALSITNSSKIEGLIENEIISISAYSPDIDRFIYTGNKKMNLNIAMSYNEYEGKTYILMGYPIIAIGY